MEKQQQEQERAERSVIRRALGRSISSAIRERGKVAAVTAGT